MINALAKGIAAAGAVAALIDEIGKLINWLDGGDGAPVILSKLPAVSQSVAIRIRERSIAAKRFGAG